VIDTQDVDKLTTAVNASSKASVLWTTFITFELYLAIAFGSITHRDLFLEPPRLEETRKVEGETISTVGHGPDLPLP
jgi:hypothetical protein